MKAIIEKELVGIHQKERVYKLGIGETEAAARRQAYDYLLHNHAIKPNEERQHHGGEVVQVAERLAELARAPDFINKYDDNGRLIGSEKTPEFGRFINALGRLTINAQGELDFVELTKEGFFP